MVMGTERSKTLHNFTLPCGLRWGNQRHLRCINVNSNCPFSSLRRWNDLDYSDYQPQRRRTTREKQRDSNGSQRMGVPTMAVDSFGAGRRFGNVGDVDDDGIAAVREKVMFDLQAVADQMKHQIFKEGLEDGEVFVSPCPPESRPLPPSPPPPAANGIQRPWHLRTRRAVVKAPLTGSLDGGFGKIKGSANGTTAGGSDSGNMTTAAVAKTGQVLSPMGTPLTADSKSLRRRSGATAESPTGEKRDRAKFSVTLLRREIEEDFMAMTLFPGLWLSEITPEMYKVTDVAP